MWKSLELLAVHVQFGVPAVKAENNFELTKHHLTVPGGSSPEIWFRQGSQRRNPATDSLNNLNSL